MPRDGTVPARARALLLLLALALLAAACGDDSPAATGSAARAAAARAAAASGGAAPDATATGAGGGATSAGAPADVPLASLLERTCAKGVVEADRRGIVAAGRIDALERSTRALERQYDDTVARIRTLSTRIASIRARIDATSDVAAANRLVDEGNALVAEHNRLAEGTGVLATRSRRQVAALNRSGRRALRAIRAFDDQVARCARSVEDDAWSAAAAPLERRIAKAARSAARRDDIEVVCVAPAVWQTTLADERASRFERTGFVRLGSTTVNLSPSTCLALDDVLRRRVPRARRPAGTGCAVPALARDVGALCGPRAAAALGAVETLAHEAEHARGIESEARATCYGMQRAGRFARALGLPRPTAAAVGAYVESVVERPAGYRSKECRRGGALDLEPATRAFP